MNDRFTAEDFGAAARACVIDHQGAPGAMAEKVVSVEDMRRAAQRRLPRMIFDFLDGGALDELTLRENESDLARIRLRQRVLQDISSCDLATEALGQPLSMPLMIAPMGLLGLFHPHGDIALAKAAAAAGTVFVHSAWSGWAIEDVAAAAPGSVWSQISFWTDTAISRDHIDRAAAAGVDVLVIAGDVAVSSKRERDLHHGLAMPPRPTLRDIANTARKPAWLTGLARLAAGPKLTYGNYRIDGRRMRLNEMYAFMRANENRAATWADVEQLRDRWSGKLVVKGVMTAEDTRSAALAGVDAVMVSNHGGRQFDAQPSTASALPEVVEAAGGAMQVFVDGGVRRGADVVKCLALGAQACLIGRPAAYGLAAGGEPGAERVLELLRDEIAVALGFVGRVKVGELDHLVLHDGSPRAAATFTS
jgi:L-lactate dehydrogenase (cytochrome)